MDRALLAAITSPRRRELLRLLWDDELPVGRIHESMPDVTLGAVSLQLKALLAAGLVEQRADKQQRYYRAARERLAPVAAMLEAMWSDALWQLKLAVELKETRRGPKPSAAADRASAGQRRTTAVFRSRSPQIHRPRGTGRRRRKG
jgi:DNA-binding transcriptional ArsR family regulator